MLLAFDIGNTNIVVGVYQEKKLLTYWRLATDRMKSSDEYGMLVMDLFRHHGIDPKAITDVIFSSVVPPIIEPLFHMVRKYFGTRPLIVGPGIKTGMHIVYENPREVGADRIVNAVSGFEKYGGPLIIVDFGTAITFCYVSETGEYMGGVITPGVNISLEALSQKTSKLPKVELVKPRRIIGKNTVRSIQSGVIYGYCGLVDGIVGRMKEEIALPAIKVVATGGLAPLIASDAKSIDIVDKLLTLEGLRIIYERNINQ